MRSIIWKTTSNKKSKNETHRKKEKNVKIDLSLLLSVVGCRNLKIIFLKCSHNIMMNNLIYISLILTLVINLIMPGVLCKMHEAAGINFIYFNWRMMYRSCRKISYAQRMSLSVEKCGDISIYFEGVFLSESFFTWPVRSSIPLVETEIECAILSIQHRGTCGKWPIVISTIAHEYDRWEICWVPLKVTDIMK